MVMFTNMKVGFILSQFLYNILFYLVSIVLLYILMCFILLVLIVLLILLKLMFFYMLLIRLNSWLPIIVVWET
jgi:hypothetical protein